MTTSPQPTPPESKTEGRESEKLKRLRLQAEETFRSIRSRATRRAYLHDWQQFCLWCEQEGFSALPATPEAIVLYATDLTKNSGRRLNTLQRRMSAISKMHQRSGHETPTLSSEVRQFMFGLRREIGVAVDRKRPVMVEDLKHIVQSLPETLLGLRNRALLLLGFTGAFRRSELVSLDVSDYEVTKDGLVIVLRRSKTDQEGEGRPVGVPYGTGATCPVRALQEWIEAAAIRDGAIFRVMNRHGQVLSKRLSGEAVSLVVKQYVEQLGFDASRFAGHSLRAGLAISAAAAGKSERSIAKQTGLKTSETVRRYVRDGNLFRDNAVDGLGL
jgi:site-specific recombinase XerD